MLTLSSTSTTHEPQPLRPKPTPGHNTKKTTHSLLTLQTTHPATRTNPWWQWVPASSATRWKSMRKSHTDGGTRCCTKSCMAKRVVRELSSKIVFTRTGRIGSRTDCHTKQRQRWDQRRPRLIDCTAAPDARSVLVVFETLPNASLNGHDTPSLSWQNFLFFGFLFLFDFACHGITNQCV